VPVGDREPHKVDVVLQREKAQRANAAPSHGIERRTRAQHVAVRRHRQQEWGTRLCSRRSRGLRIGRRGRRGGRQRLDEGRRGRRRGCGRVRGRCGRRRCVRRRGRHRRRVRCRCRGGRCVRWRGRHRGRARCRWDGRRRACGHRRRGRGTSCTRAAQGKAHDGDQPRRDGRATRGHHTQLELGCRAPQAWGHSASLW